MPRAKRGFKRRRRHNKVLDRAEGFVLGRKNKFKRTAEAVDRAFIYAYRDRRAKKRDFRQLWIARISAAANTNDISYNRLICALERGKVSVNRKMLSEIAIADPSTFAGIVNEVRSLAPTA